MPGFSTDRSVGIHNDNVVFTAFTAVHPDVGKKEGLDNSANPNDVTTNHEVDKIIGQVSKGVIRLSDVKTNGNSKDIPHSNGVIAENSPSTRLYFRRWPTLVLFCLFSFSNAFQWIHLNIIADVILKYYNESLPEEEFQRNTAVDWLSIVYMLAYIPLIFPATWLLDKKGLRLSCILGSILNALGAWLKCASVSPNRFALLMFAQTICAISQIWVLGIPARLAAVWFGPNEVSTATSLGVFGNQVGVAVGFVLPPIIVPDANSSNDVIAKGLENMAYGNAAFSTVAAILIIIFLQGNPRKPPSIAQQQAIKAAANENYQQSLVRLFSNFGFVFLTIAYGINTGSYYAISTLLNAIILYYFPGEGDNAGRIGLTIVLTGIVGSVLAGVWLDRTKTFKATTAVIYILTLTGMVAFTFTLDLHKIWVVFLTSGVLGFFMTGYLPVGFEFGAELTFPESEGTSSGLLNASAMIFGIIFTLGMRAMLDSISALSANITICAFLVAGGAITAMIKPDYRRQKAGALTEADSRGFQDKILTNGHNIL